VIFEDLIKYLYRTGREELAETMNVKIKKVLIDTGILTFKQLQSSPVEQIPQLCVYYNLMLQMQNTTLNIIQQQQTSFITTCGIDIFENVMQSEQLQKNVSLKGYFGNLENKGYHVGVNEKYRNT